MQSPTDNDGTYYMILGWVLTTFVILAVLLRVYSRVFITRSFGADDICIIISMGLSVSGEILDTLAVVEGLGRHLEYVSKPNFATILKWEYILWMMVFFSFFFVRSSILLFTLRLLPITKIWSARFVCVAIFLNFAITMFAVVSWGVVCVPFHVAYERWYEYIPNANCESPSVTVSAQKVNGIFACFLDITTAIIPTALIWNLQIKRKTKIILDFVFFLGLITSGLSVARAITFPEDIWTNDTTFRLIKASTFSLIEEKLGIIFASCPALRQLIVYISRSHTILPSGMREAPGEDFAKMRTKVKLREIFWTERSKGTATIFGGPIHPPERELDDRVRRYAEKHGKLSALDRLSGCCGRKKNGKSIWRLGSTFNASSAGQSGLRSRPSRPSAFDEGISLKRNARWPGTSGTSLDESTSAKQKMWQWPSRERERELSRIDEPKEGDTESIAPINGRRVSNPSSSPAPPTELSAGSSEAFHSKLGSMQSFGRDGQDMALDTFVRGLSGSSGGSRHFAELDGRFVDLEEGVDMPVRPAATRRTGSGDGEGGDSRRNTVC